MAKITVLRDGETHGEKIDDINANFTELYDGTWIDGSTASSVTGTDTLLVKQSGTAKNVTAEKLKDYIEAETALPYIEVTTEGDDKGLIFSEQISTGTPANPKESSFGEGDSRGVGKENVNPNEDPEAGCCWQYAYADMTGQTITTATDKTVVFASDSASTSVLFGGTTAGKCIMFGSDYNFGGLKLKIDTLGSMNPDNYVVEYYSSIANGWRSTRVMASDANFPYTQRGNKVAENTTNEQIRSGYDPTLDLTWDAVALTIGGTVYTKRWARLRLTGTITTDPIVEQIKISTNRTEINADGFMEFFGFAVYPKIMDIVKYSNADKEPTDQDIKIASGITLSGTDNKFAFNKDDGFILVNNIPLRLDTSIYPTIKIFWYPADGTAGDVELQLDTVIGTDSFVYDGNATATASTSTVTSVSSDQEAKQISIFTVDLSSALPGNRAAFSLHRDGGNGNDDYGGAIVITGWELVGYFWGIA